MSGHRMHHRHFRIITPTSIGPLDTLTVVVRACAATRLDQVPYEPHMLDAASSPLISALPQYERSFLDHLSIGQAYHAAMQVLCCSVQARA